ncbi:MAG: F0F1 ATP synthase subunit A [Candidatus Omnitrophica bacterium]|nr:F0F1 ATP synthase subunit A [Candidatus Omnitrophota bacterium]
MEHTAAAHEVGGHAQEAASPHLPTLVSILKQHFPHHPVVEFLGAWENVLFAFLVALIISTLVFVGMRRPQIVPAGLQNAIEAVFDGLSGFFKGILGAAGERYTAFPVTLFLYIWGMNIIGLVPFMKSSTSVVTTTAALAICVFLYVQSIGLSRLGLLGYLDHMAGNPRNIFQFLLAPLMFVLHVIGELAKPFSLAARLFGNISGEDIMIAVFVGFGAASLSFLKAPIGIPFHFPFFFLALLFSTLQALVFSLLSTVYIVLMLPHEEHTE